MPISPPAKEKYSKISARPIRHTPTASFLGLRTGTLSFFFPRLLFALFFPLPAIPASNEKFARIHAKASRRPICLRLCPFPYYTANCREWQVRARRHIVN